VRTLLPDDQRLLSDQQLRDASDEQLQDLIARVAEGERGRIVNDRETDRTLGFEIFKHLTTLNAGSIVLIATFLGDIFPNDRQGNLTVDEAITDRIAAAFVLLGLSLLASTYSMYQFAHFETSLSKWLKRHSNVENRFKEFLSLLRAFAGALFVLGLGFFGWAVLKNLL
jgi:hypothetical protein